MAKPAAKPRKKANGYKMPDPLPNGLILEDIAKKKWKLGPSIGKGGFGEIYSAQEYAGSPRRNSAYPYVIKIEPHANGPLFVEMHFYMRNAKPADIEAFKAANKLTTLGMPKYLGSGSHEHKGEKYRFVVMEKFGTDIWKLFLENKRRFPIETVFKLGVQILDVLEYIHNKGYIHADIKGANILQGVGKESQTQVYLVDFGLCTHYSSKDKSDPKKAHNGTIEYLSRDAHLGIETRRGDLEILGYNLTQWLGCVLPWEKNLSDPITVQKSKEKYLEDLPGFFKACFRDEKAPTALVDYFKYITAIKFDTTPDYKKLRKILTSGVEAVGGSLKSELQFKSADSTPAKRKAAAKSSSVKTPEKKARLATKKPKTLKASEETNEDEPEENGIDNDSAVKKTEKTPKRTKQQSKLQVNAEDGYTAEMLRIKNKMEAKKKPVLTAAGSSERSLRNQKNNYKSNDAISNSPDVISDSEDEQYNVVQKKSGRGRRLRT